MGSKHRLRMRFGYFKEITWCGEVEMFLCYLTCVFNMGHGKYIIRLQIRKPPLCNAHDSIFRRSYV